MSQLGATVDWQGWLYCWDVQQAGYLPDREQQFALMLEIVQRVVGEPTRFVDLACGPGSIAARAAERFPTTEIIGVDLDPFPLEIAPHPHWDAVLGDGSVDAVCSATALHWLDPTDFAEVAQTWRAASAQAASS